MADKTARKQRGKPFAKGQSGNSAGRPQGSRSRTSIFGEAILQKDADAIVEAVVAAAKAGDPTAMRLCVERLIPVRRGRPITFAMPKLKAATDVGDAISAIAAAMSIGELTPDEAGAVAAVVELRRKAIETTELEKRIAALEDAKP